MAFLGYFTQFRIAIGWALLGAKMETSMNRLATFHKLVLVEGNTMVKKVFGSDH